MEDRNSNYKGNYIFNLETTKIELHFEKADYDALSDAQKKELKGAFLWSNRGKCWVSRAKEPNLWRAKEVAKKLGFTEEQREGERLTYAEQLARQAERAEERAERYEQYADNAERRGGQLQKPLESMRGDVAFFTQPNINSSSGRAFTNRRERMYNQYHKGFEEYRKSEYFRERADTARATASDAQFRNPAYLDRRIKECKKEIRDREKRIISYEETLYAIENGEERRNYNGEIISVEAISSGIERELELVEKAMDKQGYLENCLDAVGGIRFSKDNIKVGYIVTIQRWGLVEIVSVGAVNVGFKILTGGAAGGLLKAAYAEIIEVVKAVEKKREAHPFKVGEQFSARRYISESDGMFGFKHRTETVLYEIVKVSNTTIQLKELGSDAKPLVRKPTKRHDGSWCFSIDDSYQNTFYKKCDEAV